MALKLVRFIGSVTATDLADDTAAGLELGNYQEVLHLE